MAFAHVTSDSAKAAEHIQWRYLNGVFPLHIKRNAVVVPQT